MTRNSAFAEKLVKRLQPLPSIMGAAVAKAAYRAVLSNTHQDSGVAAFNWRAQVNNRQVRTFSDQRGRSPVGSTGDQRSSRGDYSIVVNDRYDDFVSRLTGKDIRFVYMYNPIDDPHHAQLALIGEALALATGRDWLEDVARNSIRAHL